MVPPEKPDDPGTARLAALDEILQVLYWLRGERLAADVSATDLTRWVGLAAPEIEPLLERLAASGLVQPVGGRPAAGPLRYALTPAGVREGGRRFADEFADLTRPGHGECGDPNCECQRTGDPADCEHRQA
jgi:hypothetical protein